MPTFGDRLTHAWNAFMNRDPTPTINYGEVSYSNPVRTRPLRGTDRSIVSSIYTRLSMDVAAIAIKHVKIDKNGGYVEDVDSYLNNCLTVEANKDQTSRAFIQNVVMEMLEEGCVAIVPVDTTENPNVTGSYDIKTMRTAKVLEWAPDNIRVQIYNDRLGKFEELWVPKRNAAIIQNPFYSIMNEPNSTLQRLIRKLNLLDGVDEQSSSGKLDLIIQLPYVIKSEARRTQAEQRRKEIEMQLEGSKFGIAYTDGTEKIVQLNRPVENNLLKSIEYLTNQVYAQIGITEEILNGKADEQTMTNYYNQAIEPLISAIRDEYYRKFLTKTARSQMQSILFFRQPFKLVPVSAIAEIADKFTRNEIMSPNEVRQVVGLKPDPDPESDKLRNRNLNKSTEQIEEDLGQQSQEVPELPVADDASVK